MTLISFTELSLDELKRGGVYHILTKSAAEFAKEFFVAPKETRLENGCADSDIITRQANTVVD